MPNPTQYAIFHLHNGAKRQLTGATSDRAKLNKWWKDFRAKLSGKVEMLEVGGGK